METMTRAEDVRILAQDPLIRDIARDCYNRTARYLASDEFAGDVYNWYLANGGDDRVAWGAPAAAVRALIGR